jgi:CheY-like chemotaxis protein/GAF domain-containing protein
VPVPLYLSRKKNSCLLRDRSKPSTAIDNAASNKAINPLEHIPMHRVMSRQDDIGSRDPTGAPEYKNGAGTTPYLNVNLEKCLETIQNAAVCAQHDENEKAESNNNNSAFDAATRQLESGYAAQEVDDVLRSSSTTSSEEPSETSCLDKEVKRLRVLKSYLGVLDCDHGNKFERLTALASRIFGVPMAQVAIADLDKQYCISSRGINHLTARNSPFCSHAVLADCDILVVGDATKDSRFQQDPQVATTAKVRFYAGAPLICPEGYRLGTLCVMDTEPRLTEVALEEKQSLMELAGMAMETLVDLRTKKTSALRDPSQQIACTAHDLLTPLTGIALSLSLLKEDEALQRKLTEQQRDMIETAANCSAVMNSICLKTMNFFRDQGRREASSHSRRSSASSIKKVEPGPGTVNVSDFVKNLNMIMEPFPKHVPIIITVDPTVPREFICDDMKIFRSAANFLTNACAKTETGSIHFRIFCRTNVEKLQELVFECEDTGPGVDVRKYAYLFKPVREELDPLRVSKSRTVLQNVPSGACRDGVQNTGLGLYSVATQISSIGGKYGFSPRGQRNRESSVGTEETGSIFWFAIPLVTPQNLFVAQNGTGKTPVASAATTQGDSKKAAGIGDDNPRRQRMLGAQATHKKTEVSGITGAPSGSSAKGHKRRLSADDALEAYASSKASLAVSKRDRSPVSAGRRVQALVIEDSIVVSKSLARVLTRLGFEVTQAMNGMEGLKALKAALFDLVLCDFLMPVMDGLDCIQQYRQWEAVNRPYFTQYIVGMSAHASEKDVDQGLKIGMNEFRAKPVTYNQLTELRNGQEFQRTSMELDTLGHEIECLKRRKTETDSDQRSSESSNRKFCLVVEGGTVLSKLANLASETIGWKIVAVTDKDSALGLLKMRNWDSVLVDDELGSSRCIAIFREWEKTHRVNRQKNVVLMSANFVKDNHGASFQVPTGFDGALGKPIELDALQSFLEKAKSTCDIVTR